MNLSAQIQESESARNFKNAFLIYLHKREIQREPITKAVA